MNINCAITVLDLSQSLEEETLKVTSEQHGSKHHDKHEDKHHGGRIIKNTRYAPDR